MTCRFLRRTALSYHSENARLSGLSAGLTVSDPISGILGALAQGASAVPGIAALFGETKAQKDQKKILEETLREQQAVAELEAKSWSETITTAAPYVAVTVLGLGGLYIFSRWWSR